MVNPRLIVNRWIRSYTKAWLKKDAKAIAALFTEDAIYNSHPFRPATHSRKSILDYTLGALDVGQVYEVRFGKPVVEGSRAAVEYWTTMKEKVEDVTLAGLRNAPLREERSMQGATRLLGPTNRKNPSPA